MCVNGVSFYIAIHKLISPPSGKNVRQIYDCHSGTFHIFITFLAPPLSFSFSIFFLWQKCVKFPRVPLLLVACGLATSRDGLQMAELRGPRGWETRGSNLKQELSLCQGRTRRPFVEIPFPSWGTLCVAKGTALKSKKSVASPRLRLSHFYGNKIKHSSDIVLLKSINIFKPWDIVFISISISIHIWFLTTSSEILSKYWPALNIYLNQIESSPRSSKSLGPTIFPFNCLLCLFCASTKCCLFGSKVFLRYEMFA